MSQRNPMTFAEIAAQLAPATPVSQNALSMSEQKLMTAAEILADLDLADTRPASQSARAAAPVAAHVNEQKHAAAVDPAHQGTRETDPEPAKVSEPDSDSDPDIEVVVTLKPTLPIALPVALEKYLHINPERKHFAGPARQVMSDIKGPDHRGIAALPGIVTPPSGNKLVEVDLKSEEEKRDLDELTSLFQGTGLTIARDDYYGHGFLTPARERLPVQPNHILPKPAPKPKRADVGHTFASPDPSGAVDVTDDEEFERSGRVTYRKM